MSSLYSKNMRRGVLRLEDAMHTGKGSGKAGIYGIDGLSQHFASLPLVLALTLGSSLTCPSIAPLLFTVSCTACVDEREPLQGSRLTKSCLPGMHRSTTAHLCTHTLTRPHLKRRPPTLSSPQPLSFAPLAAFSQLNLELPAPSPPLSLLVSASNVTHFPPIS